MGTMLFFLIVALGEKLCFGVKVDRWFLVLKQTGLAMFLLLAA